MAQNYTAFDVRVFDAHVFQIFGASPRIAHQYIEGNERRHRRKLTKPPRPKISYEIPEKAPPPPPPVPPRDIFARSEEESSFTPSVGAPVGDHDVKSVMALQQRIRDAQAMQDIQDALAAIAVLEAM